MTKLPTSKTALVFVFFLLLELCHGENFSELSATAWGDHSY